MAHVAGRDGADDLPPPELLHDAATSASAKTAATDHRRLVPARFRTGKP